MIYFSVFPSFLHNYLGQSWIAPQDEALGLELALFTTSREFDGFEYRGWRLKVSEESKAESIRRHEDFSGRRGHGERGFPLGFRDQGRSGHRNQWGTELHRGTPNASREQAAHGGFPDYYDPVEDKIDYPVLSLYIARIYIV